MHDPWWPVATVIGLMLVWHTLRVTSHLPEPRDAGDKPAYSSLFVGSRILIVTVLGGAAAALAMLAPPQLRPVFVVWGSSALVLIAIDALTTWLPLRVTQLVALHVGVSLGIGLLLDATRWQEILVGAFVGAAGAGGFFWLMWRFSGALGFGDVRLAALVGAITGAWSFEAWWVCQLGGTVLGALLGIIHSLRRHRRTREFAYGPALWAGPYCALAANLTGWL